MSLLKRFGRITQFDFMFENNGPNAGVPRGYAYAQFSSREEALQAKIKLDNRKLLLDPM